MWWGVSKARARSQPRVSLEEGNATSLGRCFEPEDFSSPRGLDEQMVRDYIRNQEDHDERMEQMTLQVIVSPDWRGDIALCSLSLDNRQCDWAMPCKYGFVCFAWMSIS
jgi:hypothetical protein